MQNESLPELLGYCIYLGAKCIDFLIEILRSQLMVLIFMRNEKTEKTDLQVSLC